MLKYQDFGYALQSISIESKVKLVGYLDVESSNTKCKLNNKINGLNGKQLSQKI